MQDGNLSELETQIITIWNHSKVPPDNLIPWAYNNLYSEACAAQNRWKAEHWNDLRREGRLTGAIGACLGIQTLEEKDTTKYRIFDIGKKQAKKENTDITTCPNRGRKSFCHKLQSYCGLANFEADHERLVGQSKKFASKVNLKRWEQ